MNNLDEDLNDSSLFCKSLIQKQKNINIQHCKQPKLPEFSSNINQSDNYKKVKNNLLENKAESFKYNDDWDPKESKSIYFCAKVSANSCPVCLKSFNTDSSYSSHMKQCAKSHRMTTQELLKALELQKKQRQERRDMGLCSQVVPLFKKSATKKNTKNDKEYDLALGLALSRSLMTCEQKTVSSQEMQTVTLEDFGFKSNNNATTNKKRHENVKKSVLKNRTAEERQKIIVEKVAVVLLDEDGEEMNLKKEKLNRNSSFQSYQVPQLWNLAENGENDEWYVNKIKPLILCKEENTVESTKPILSDNIKNEVSKLSLPRKEIFSDWKKMINNNFKSDWIGKAKDGQNIYLHSLVLYARCPEILEKDYRSIFQKFNLSTIIILLEYLYCGTLDGLIASEINNLFDLVVELNFNELINILNHIKGGLLGSCSKILNAPLELKNIENNGITHEITLTENKEHETVEDKDFTQDLVGLTQSSPRQVYEVNDSSSDDESNAEKSYWSFLRHEKEKENILISEKMKTKENQEKERLLMSNGYDEEEKESNLLSVTDSDKLTELNGKLSDNPETRDLIDEFQGKNVKMGSSDCIIISSESETQTEENSFKPQGDRSNTPSSVDMEYEIPHVDFYNDFHCFSEEQFSPVGLQSQSLLVGDISAESLKLSDPSEKYAKRLDVPFQEELKETVGYCSTPVSVGRVSKINNNSLVKNKKRKKSDLSANRILRKSLGLQHKVRSHKKSVIEKRRSSSYHTKQFAKALTNSILNELSRSSLFNSSPARAKKFVEITPISNAEEFVESVTPLPNYSGMGASMLKEQLMKYGLKKNLAKSKAKKILNLIYEELHPYYNIKTKKIVKMSNTVSPKVGKNIKSKAGCGKNAKVAKNKNETSKEKSKLEKKTKNDLNSSKRSINYDSEGSDFDDLNETLTQSVPNDRDDLPSVFNAFIRNNSEYHQKILLYEPIWLEELQKKLKETFQKHFKLSDIMDFLDQKCITFRSAAQAKKLLRRNERKENSKKRKKL